MASAKEIKKKIKSISNTKKITRTMEMVAASKSKKTTRRVETTTPYFDKLGELLENLCAGQNVSHKLIEPEDGREPESAVGRRALLVVTANRGLCGGYNTNVLQLAERWMQAEKAAGRTSEVSMIGKKGIARFRFRKRPVLASYTHTADWPRFEHAEDLARGFRRRFLSGVVDEVFVASTRYFSAGMQKPVLTRLIPIARPRTDHRDVRRLSTEFIFEPDPETLLRSLLPFSIAYLLFRLLVEAAACEQIARRVAMKMATDNAEELVKIYTRRYNRQRQAGITQQIMEIVGGAEALD